MNSIFPTLAELGRNVGSYASPANIVHRVLSLLGSTSLGTSSGYLDVVDSRTGRKYVIPIEHNSVQAVDFRRITAAGLGADYVDQFESGLKVLDQGFMNTACVKSSITLIDGQRGYIQYRHHSLDDLIEKNHDWEDVTHLLIWDHLPTPEQKHSHRRALADQMRVPPQPVLDCIQSFPRDGLPGTMITAVLSAFASLDEGTISTHTRGEPYYLNNLDRVDAAIIRSIANMAVTIALVHCHKRGIDFTPADPDNSFIGNLLRMMGKDDPLGECEKVLERLWVLYADHEMTNSTAAFLHAASTLTDPMSCTLTGIISAYGPLHGGAIDLAYQGFEEVGTVENVPTLIAKVKAKKQRLFGYGHRVYKTVDPRTKYIRQMMDDNIERFRANPLLRVALEIDRVANEDPYFTSRKLKANADLYGCLLYTALGFETDIILGLACLSRTPGVMAHWRESMQQPPRLWRPQQVFIG